jgi:hypothetical protein
MAYVLAHPGALSFETAAQALEALLRAAALAWVAAVAAALGRRALTPLALGIDDRAERLVLEIGLGLGLLSFLLLAFGALGLWTAGPLAVLFLLLSAALAGVDLDVRRLRPSGRIDWTQALFLFPIVLAALHGFISAAAPPTDWDSLAVHLEIPRQYARLGGLQPLRWLAHGLDPMAVEMFYVPALVFKDAAMPAMISLLFQGLMAAAAWTFGRRLSSRGAALAAAALFLSQPAVVYVSGTPGTDFGVGLFAMLAFWTAWRAVESEEGRWLILSGAFTGLAAVSKTTGIFLAVALAAALAAAAARRAPGLRRHAPVWVGAAALFSAPWFLRSWIRTGNPVWPYLPGLFGGTARDAYLYARAKAAVTEGLGYGWREFLLLPLNLVFKPENFRHSSQWLMIPLLVLGAASARDAWRKPFVRWTAVYAAVFTVLWFQGVQEWRYFIPLMPWLCLLICDWAAKAWSGGGPRRLAACALVVGFLGLPETSANNALYPVLGLRPSDASLTPRDAYLGRSLNSYAAMRHVNRDFPANAKILLYGEIRPFYLERDYLIGDPQNETSIRYEELRTPEELYRRLRGLGITGFLVDPSLSSFNADLPAFRRADAMLRAVLERYASAPEDVGGARLYSWKEP